MTELAGSAPTTGAGPPWIVGETCSPPGIPRVATTWRWQDRLGHFLCRVSSLREHYAVPPGLYAVGRPHVESDVVVTANYKLTFDIVRRSLRSMDAWILVLDTQGVNVWCAAGKRTFGTAEIVRRVRQVGLEGVVAHRRLVLPQLGAPGVSAHEVQRQTGFRVSYGPVRAADLPAYLRAGRKATDEMRRVRFPLHDRLVLTPMEVVPALKAFPVFGVVMLLIFGIGPGGIRLERAWTSGLPYIGLGLAAVLAGALLTPLLLPIVPGRAFSVKGAVVGMCVTLAYAAVVPGVRGESPHIVPFTYLFFPAVSSFLALMFTGSTPFTGASGVRKELRHALPVHAVIATVSLALLAVLKVTTWRAS